MEALIKQTLDNFDNIFNTLSKDFKWSSNQLINIFTALIYSINNCDYDKSIMLEMHSIIKDTTGTFSHYRGYDKFIIPAKLITKYDDPKDKLLKMFKYEDMLKEYGFSHSTYSALATYILLTTVANGGDELRIRKAKAVYDAMRQSHFWITGQDDYPLAFLLSASEDSAGSIVNEVDKLYDQLHLAGFTKGNTLQFLSHILSFSSKQKDEKVKECRYILDYFKNKKLKLYSSDYGILGLLALIYNNNNTLLDEIIEVYEYTKTLKGIKWSGKNVQVLIAASIITSKYIESFKDNSDLIETSLGISIQAIIAAQTAAMVASMTAVSAAAAASASS